MFDIGQCNCEGIDQRQVQKWKLEHPEIINPNYSDVIHEVFLDRINGEDKLIKGYLLHPGDIRSGLLKRRLFDPLRYLRNGGSPSELFIYTPEGEEISYDLNYIPTLANDTLPLVNGDVYKKKAWDELLLRRTNLNPIEKNLLEKIVGENSLVPFFNPLYKMAANLLISFDPLCSNCPARANGDCIPSVVYISNYEKLITDPSGYIEIERRLIAPMDKH